MARPPFPTPNGAAPIDDTMGAGPGVMDAAADPAMMPEDEQTEEADRVTVVRVTRTLGAGGEPLYSVETGDEPEAGVFEQPLMAGGAEGDETDSEGTSDVNVLLARVAEAVDADAKKISGGPSPKENFDKGYEQDSGI